MRTRALPPLQELFLPLGFRVVVTGHSLGASSATLATLLLRDALGPAADLHCYAFATCPCVDRTTATSARVRADVTTVVHCDDAVTRWSLQNVRGLLAEIECAALDTRGLVAGRARKELDARARAAGVDTAAADMLGGAISFSDDVKGSLKGKAAGLFASALSRATALDGKLDDMASMANSIKGKDAGAGTDADAADAGAAATSGVFAGYASSVRDRVEERASRIDAAHTAAVAGAVSGVRSLAPCDGGGVEAGAPCEDRAARRAGSDLLVPADYHYYVAGEVVYCARCEGGEYGLAAGLDATHPRLAELELSQAALLDHGMDGYIAAVAQSQSHASAARR